MLRPPLAFVTALLLTRVALAVQTVSLGVIGGVPVTSAYETTSILAGTAQALMEVSYTSRAKPFTFGPAAELSLPRGFALEFDALYKRIDYNASFNEIFVNFNQPILGLQVEHNVVSRWDLPLLLKHSVKAVGAYRLYLGGGLNTNYIVNTTQIGFHPTIGQQSLPAELRYRSAEGILVTSGFEFSLHHLRIAPELRYTRWAHENFNETVSGVGTLRSNLNQAEVLIRLGFTKQ